MHPQPLRFLAAGLIAAAAAALLGCASTGGGYAGSRAATARSTAPLPGKPGCFWVADFDGSWTALNDSELIVADPVFSRSYLLQLYRPVADLKFRHRLGFEVFPPDLRRICTDSLDYLLVPRWVHVPIVAVRELTAPEERLLLLQNHVKAPARLPARSSPGTAI